MREISTKEIGKLLREAREKKQKKQIEVAKAIGVKSKCDFSRAQSK